MNTTTPAFTQLRQDELAQVLNFIQARRLRIASNMFDMKSQMSNEEYTIWLEASREKARFGILDEIEQALKSETSLIR